MRREPGRRGRGDKGCRHLVWILACIPRTQEAPGGCNKGVVSSKSSLPARILYCPEGVCATLDYLSKSW